MQQSVSATSLKDALDVQVSVSKMPSVGSVKKMVTVNYQWLQSVDNHQKWHFFQSHTPV